MEIAKEINGLIAISSLSKIDDEDNYSVITESTIVKNYLAEISKFPLLKQEEEEDLLIKYFKKNDLDAGKQIVLSHLRLVVKIAVKYKNYGINLMELISEGNLGLMHALKKFDLKKGVRFATYAMLWIRASMQDLIMKSWSVVKTESDAIMKKALFTNNNQKTKIINNEITLDGLNPDFDLSNKLASDILNPEENFSKNEEHNIKQKSLENALTILDINEKKIIESRYLSDKKETFDTLGKKFNLSKERIRQIEEKAIKKMQNFLNAR